MRSSSRRACPRPARARSCAASCARSPRAMCRAWAIPPPSPTRRSSTISSPTASAEPRRTADNTKGAGITPRALFFVVPDLGLGLEVRPGTGGLRLAQFRLSRQRLVLERVEMHPAPHDRAEQQHCHTHADRDPAEQVVDVQQAGLGHLAVMATGRFADLAGDEIADRSHVEPRTHDQRSKELGREPVHRRKADRRQAKLGGGGEEVVSEDQDHRRHRLNAPGVRAPNQYQIGQAHLQQRDTELGGGRWLEAPFTQELPQAGEERCEQDDVDRVDRLEDASGHVAAIDEFVGEQVHRPARLLEQSPEDRVQRDQEQDREHAFAGFLGQLEALVEHITQQRDARNREQRLNDVLILHQPPDHRDSGEAHTIEQQLARSAQLCRSFARAVQHALAQHEYDQAREHADSRQAEAEAPADRLA
eukprot:Opistho-1_new@53202